MSQAEKDKKEILKSFVKEHAKTPEQIKAEIKTMEEAKKQYTRDVTILEGNLRKFNETLDPLIDPATNEPLCWVRRPSQDEWDEMIPDELRQYPNPEDVPVELASKYKNHQFDMMAKLIDIPKHDAAWWRQNGSNLVFQELFQLHLVEVYKKLGIMVGNF